ncbi:MAG: C39 family peptidase [Planctomycetes bacterium]|nr:C39 family peptidase [Planctomycetota bacterium]
MKGVFGSLALLLAGCAYLGTAQPFDPASAEPGFILLDGIQPLRQRVENDCGPTALTMVLRYHDEPISLEDVIQACPPREGGGVTAAALRDFARRHRFRAHVVVGTIDDLRKHLSLGRPLIVGLVKPYVDRLRPHFEVVAGFHPEALTVVTVDPAQGWTKNSVDGFLAEWEPAQRLMLVIAPAP